MKRLLPVVLGIALFLVVLWKVPLRQTWEILLHIQWAWASLAFVLIMLMVVLKAARWSFLLRMQGVSYPVWDSFLIYMGSLFWGTVTPGRMGDFMKILYLKRDRKMGYGLGMSSVLVDRVFDLYILLTLGCLGLILHPMPNNPQMVRGVWVFFGILIVISFLAFHRKTGEWLLKGIFEKALGNKLKSHAGEAFQQFHQGMEAFYRPAILWPTALTILSYLGFFISCEMMAKSLGIDIGIYYLTFCVAVVNIASLVTFAGFGTREGTLILLFQIEHFTDTQALAFSMLLFFIGTILVGGLGFLAYLLKPVKFEASGTLPDAEVPQRTRSRQPQRTRRRKK